MDLLACLPLQSGAMVVKESGEVDKDGADGMAFSKEGDRKGGVLCAGCLRLAPNLDGG